jgi:hypothetical protein
MSRGEKNDVASLCEKPPMIGELVSRAEPVW